MSLYVSWIVSKKSLQPEVLFLSAARLVIVKRSFTCFLFSKVKLKIKVDPSRFKAAPTSSPSPVQMTPPPMSAPPSSVLKLSIPAGVIPSTRPESPAATSPTHFDFKCDQVWPPKMNFRKLFFIVFKLNWRAGATRHAQMTTLSHLQSHTIFSKKII